jgi:hypothetical protein
MLIVTQLLKKFKYLCVLKVQPDDQSNSTHILLLKLYKYFSIITR